MAFSIERFETEYIKDLNHAKHVQSLALMIFDEVSGIIKEMSGKKRRLLEVSALLHDIGYSIGSKGHNKFSQKLILENGIEGFEEEEIQIISCVARYHRGGKPDKKNHEVFCHLNKKQRKTVKRLAGILRIADGLDRNHAGLIQGVKLDYDEENRICFFILVPKNSEFRPDISDAIKKRDVFEGAFKVQTIFKYE